MVRMYAEMFAGLHKNPRDILQKTFTQKYDEMVLVKDIGFESMCVPSKQLVNGADGAKRAANVSVGDRLWSLDNGRVVETTVIAASRQQTRELVAVQTQVGTFCVTPDHPFATPGGWVEAQNLEGNQVEWTFPRSLCRNRYPVRVGYWLGYAIGTVFSDGTVGKRCLSLVVNEREFAAKFAMSLREEFGAEVTIEKVSRPSGFLGRELPGYRVRIVSSFSRNSSALGRVVTLITCASVSRAVVLNTQDCMQGFLDGYIDGDGCRNKTSGAFVVSSNIPFLQEMAEAIGAPFQTSWSNKLVETVCLR